MFLMFSCSGVLKEEVLKSGNDNLNSSQISHKNSTISVDQPQFVAIRSKVHTYLLTLCLQFSYFIPNLLKCSPNFPFNSNSI